MYTSVGVIKDDLKETERLLDQLEAAEEVDQLEETVPPLRIIMRSLTIQRVSPVRIDLRRVPPIRIRRLELEAELPAEDADVSIIHGDDRYKVGPN